MEVYKKNNKNRIEFFLFRDFDCGIISTGKHDRKV